MKRQLDDYFSKFYIKQAQRFEQLDANNHQIAKDIAQWKENLVAHWDAINVVSKDTTFLENGGETGVRYQVKYVIDEQGLDDAIGLEIVSLRTLPDSDGREVYKIIPFKMVKHEGNQYTFVTELEPDVAGTFKSCVRMYPKNAYLPHRQDFCYVKWLD